MQHEVSPGTLLQLVATGVSDRFQYFSDTGMPHNLRESMYKYWFINNDDGFATETDILEGTNDDNIISEHTRYSDTSCELSIDNIVLPGFRAKM